MPRSPRPRAADPRRARGGGAHDAKTAGDARVAEALLAALAHREPVERFTHGFHTYPASLHPLAARDLVALTDGATLCDPFCGGGSVLVEARVASRRAIGVDLSPTAVRVARIRCAAPSEETLTAFRSRARKLTELAREAAASGPLPDEARLKALGDWYADCALRELESLRTGIANSDPTLQPALEAVFSSILVKVSWRESDTSMRRRQHRRPPGTTAVFFHKRARELARMQTALREALPDAAPPVRVLEGDARALARLLDAPCDAIVTSPPYPATYDYLPMQHLRRIWLDDEASVDAELGSRRQWRKGTQRARRQWVADTQAWTAAAAAVLAPGGRLVVVIGDGLHPGGIEDASGPTQGAARRAGLAPIAEASVARSDHARGTTRREHALIFEKPAAG